MNKLTLIAALVGCAILTGCGTIQARWGGDTVITDKDGNPYVVNGVVQTKKDANEFYSRRVGLDTELGSATMDVEGNGKYSLTLNSYKSSVSPENSKMIDAVANLTERAIAAVMTCGVSTITKDSISGIQAVASQYIAAGGTLVPTITVNRDPDGNLTKLTFSDGRVTQSGTISTEVKPTADDKPTDNAK